MKRRTPAAVLLSGGIVVLAGGVWLLIREQAGGGRRISCPTPAQRSSADSRAAPPGRGTSEADRVAALSLQYRDASPAERKALQPLVMQTLRSYRKEWQGNKQKQLLFEASYLDLASRVKADLPEGADRSAASDVAQKSALRMKYLADDEAVRAGADEVRRFFRLGDYAHCRNLAESLVSGSYGAVPPSVELALGVSCDCTGDLNAALGDYLEVIERCNREDPEKASAAAYLAGYVLIQRGDYDNALRMFRAVITDYPDSSYAAKAQTLCDHLRDALKR